MYGVYDLQNNEICVGIFDNRKDLADFLGKTATTIGSTITRKQLVKKRYIIEMISDYYADYEEMTVLNINENKLYKDKKIHKLTKIETDVLLLLSNNKYNTAKEIQKFIYGTDKTKLDRAIIHRLKQKTKINIKSRYEYGYFTDEKIYIDF